MEDNVIQESSIIKITVKMAWALVTVVVLIIGVLLGWGQIQMSSMENHFDTKISTLNDKISGLEKEANKIYIIETKNLPDLEKYDLLLRSQQLMLLRVVAPELIMEDDIVASDEFSPELPQ